MKWVIQLSGCLINECLREKLGIIFHTEFIKVNFVFFHGEIVLSQCYRSRCGLCYTYTLVANLRWNASCWIMARMAQIVCWLKLQCPRSFNVSRRFLYACYDFPNTIRVSIQQIGAAFSPHFESMRQKNCVFIWNWKKTAKINFIELNSMFLIALSTQLSIAPLILPWKWPLEERFYGQRFTSLVSYNCHFSSWRSVSERSRHRRRSHNSREKRGHR